MIILTNDYASNLPGTEKVSQGGPANFAERFSSYVKKRKHTWVGITHAWVKTTPEGKRLSKPRSYQIVKGSFFDFWKVEIPYRHYTAITQAKRKVDPSDILSDEVETIRKIIRKTRPDLLFLNGFSLYAWILLRAASQEGLPVVVQHAGILKKEIDIYPDQFTKWGSRALLEMEKDVSRFATHEIFLNDFSRRVYAKEVAKPRTSSIIALPWRAVKAKKDIKKPPSKEIYLGVIARWDRIKNHQAVLELAREIRAQGLPWKIHCITNVPDSPVNKKMKEEYKRLVVVEPPRPANELPGFYREMDIMLLPSYFDVCPNVVMEGALLHRGTLISPNVGWVDAYRETGNAAWIIDFSKPNKVIQKITSLHGKSLSPAFYQKIKQNHAPQGVFASYMSIFKHATKV